MPPRYHPLMQSTTQELTVRSESIQRLYALYIADRFLVNRRYQRKLVWSVEEKQKLIDSILRDLPLPLFLVAENTRDVNTSLELIDGLQRLNAVFSFLENEYPLNGAYFDLDALADTKLKKDRGELVQKTPTMSREDSGKLANYAVALSVFRASDEASIEEVFRRINSGGRRLSRQSLRQAGTISRLADLVRVVSSSVRGDTSPSESVPLSVMPQLSITNYNLEYGVNVDDIFWVQQGVLRREDVRESLDEQLVLDILLDCMIDPLQTSGTRIRDAYYNYGEEEGADTKESRSAELAIEASGSQPLVDAFMRTYDELRATILASGKKFTALVGAGSGGRSPRYYHATFMAFYELMYRDGMRVADYEKAARALVNIGQGALQVPGGGGDWGADQKRTAIDGVKGVLRSSFEKSGAADDLGQFSYASQLETLLGNALVEQQQFDSKQGLLQLGSGRKLDEGCLRQIGETLSAMANSGPLSVGYVALGIADNSGDAARVTQLDGVVPISYRGFHMVGIEREARVLGKNLNEYWLWIIQKLASMSVLDRDVARSIGAASRLVSYHGLAVGLLRVNGQSQPVMYDGKLFERRGSSTVLVDPSDYLGVYRRFVV